MPNFDEGTMRYTFPEGNEVLRLQDCAFYKKHWQNFAVSTGDSGNKETDFISLVDRTLWLIEAKDYRQKQRGKTQPLDKEFAQKCRDSLSCLAGMRLSSWANPEELQLAAKALNSTSIRCVLHVEFSRPSKLFPQVFEAPDIADSVRRSLRALDPQAKAGNSAFLNSCRLPFTITV